MTPLVLGRSHSLTQRQTDNINFHHTPRPLLSFLCPLVSSPWDVRNAGRSGREEECRGSDQTGRSRKIQELNLPPPVSSSSHAAPLSGRTLGTAGDTFVMADVINNVADWIAQNRDKIEKGVEILGQASEVLATTVGQLNPVLQAVFKASAEIFSNPDGQEASYLVQQLEQVNSKLEGVQNEVDQIALELLRTSMNKQNFDWEAQMLSQYDKFQDFINAKPKFKEKKMQKFISHFENTDGDLNLDALYNSVTGETMAGDPMLETVMTIEKRNRRKVEVFCASLKKLFVKGIIAVMGYAALTEKMVGEEMMQKWQKRMEDVETRMKAAVDDCVKNFAVQAKLDLEQQLQENPGPATMEFAKSLLESLVKKYDWVCWSIRVFNNSEWFFLFQWLVGKDFHGSVGANCFDFLTKTDVKVVVSFCVDPKPIDKGKIAEQIDNEKIKGNMIRVAQWMNKSFPDCLVHAVSRYKEVVETNNFQPECYYFCKHKRAYVCVHPE